MGYSKAETEKKQRKLVSKTQRNTRKVLVILFKIILVGIIAVIIAGAGAGFGMMKGILDNAPDTSSINIVPQGYRSNIRSQDGTVEKQISTIDSNRVYVYYDQIPKDMVNAFVAIEDQRFWTHNGIDVRGIFRAFAKGAASGHFNEGASTLTQQLIKNQVFNVGLDETTFMDKLERKIQEQYLAIELEKQYTKEEIVEYYLNTIYLGRGVSGVQAASEKYFGKDMTELTISEIAVIAGIPQNPSRYDPVANPDENKKRRAEVLKKMLEQEYITQQQYDEAVADDVYARIDAEHEVQLAESDVNSYYQDAIINGVVELFMDMYDCTKAEAENKLYTGGYDIYSAQDKAIQKICDDVINNPEYVDNSTKVGLSYRLTLLGADKETNYNYSIGDLTNYFAEQTGNSKYNNIYPSEQDARAAADTFKEAMLEETDGTYVAEAFSVSPQPQFSFTIMDQHTGYVKALVGGRGAKTVNRAFNRATEAERQPGSTFKIVAAYAPLIDSGKAGLATSFNDEPYQYASGNEVRNAGGGHSGYCTIRKSIASSINVCAVKAITEETPEAAFEYLLKFGYTTLVDQKVDSNGTLLTDKTQACALGGLSYGVTNYEMTAAYASIANGGVYNQPILFTKIIDHDGNVVVDNTTGVSGSSVTTTSTTAVTGEGGTSDNNAGAGTVTTAANGTAGGSSSSGEAAPSSGSSAGGGAVSSGLSVDAALGERAEEFFVRSQELSNLLTFRVMETDDSDYITFDVDPSVEFYTRDLSLDPPTYCNTHTAYFARVTDSRFGSTADIINYYNSLYYSDGWKDSYYGCTLVSDGSGLGPVLGNSQQYSVAYIDHNGKLYQNTFYPNGRHPVMNLFEDYPVIIKDRTDTSFTAIIPYYTYDISAGMGGCELMSFAIDPACGDWRIVKEEFDDFSYYEECRQKLGV